MRFGLDLLDRRRKAVRAGGIRRQIAVFAFLVKEFAQLVFLLDINQKSSAPLLSLDQLQIFIGNSGNLTGYDTTTRQLAGLTAVFDMNFRRKQQ